jgi:threonine dehydrogenase-like Zn-dependent dehydrogenase
MKAIVYRKPMDFTIEELQIPILDSDEVLIKIKASGICTNDMRDFKGESNYTFPRIGGHEYCGVIEEIGSKVNKKRFHIGQRVVTYIIEDCKECYFCKHGMENICEEFPKSVTFLNPDGISGYGGFAEYLKVKVNDIYIYPDTTPFEKMVLTEPLACVINSINASNIKFGDDVVVIGGGTMGLLHVMAAKLRGARVILSEPLLERREKAIELGCSDTFSPIDVNPIDKVKQLTSGRGANVVFNTTAIPSVAEQAIEMTAPGGICLIFSSIHPNNPLAVNGGAIHSQQKTITGTVSPTIESFQQAVEIIAKGILDPTVLIEKIYDFEDFGLAMQTALRPDTYKVIIKFGELK